MLSRVSHPWCVREALRWARERLAGCTEPDLSAKVLLAHVLDCTVTDLFVHPERALQDSQLDAYRELIARRARHEPVAYLVGHRAFLDLDLIVDARVLVPRPETEVLVERALALAERWPAPRIADVGTGSGAIAVSLAVHLPRSRVYAVDRSPGALQVARENACRCGVCDRIVFVEGDLVVSLRSAVEMIVANLPYVAGAEYAALPPEVRLYEPREALVSGADGLDAIRALLHSARPHLAGDGIILLEIGADQGQAACELAAQSFPDARIQLYPDYAARDRVVCIDLQRNTQVKRHFERPKGVEKSLRAPGEIPRKSTSG